MDNDENNSGVTQTPSGDDGYQNDGYSSSQGDSYGEDSIDSASGPAVASSANKNIIIIIIAGVIGLFLIYQIFSGDDSSVPAPSAPPPSSGDSGASVAPISELPQPAAPMQVQQLPPPPPLVKEEPLPAPAPPPLPTNPDIDFFGEGPNDEELMARRASQMLIVSGNKTDKDEIEEQQKNFSSAAERAVATHVGDLDRLVLQGKVIDAVLETALDTTLPGPLRAVVARDVYSESGYGVLIPKGSRLIGTYNTDVVRGQGRVFIAWNRLILPDGIDLQINSQAIDGLGRSGMPGIVDDRYFEIFGGAILTSVLGIALAGVADAILEPEGSSETAGADGTTTTTGSSVDTAITASVETIGGAATQIVGGLLDARPSITVDQGSPLKVFVGRDLEFPTERAERKVRIIQ